MEIIRKLEKPVFETRPLYLQIFDRLLGYIADGTWKSGAMVPNEIELARTFGVSVGTMRKALQALSERGLLTRRQGRGTYVSEMPSGESPSLDNLRTRRMDALTWEIKSIQVTSGLADDDEQRALSLTDGASVVRIRKVLADTANDTHVLEYCRYPIQRFENLEKDTAAHTMPLGALARRYGLLAAPASEQLELHLADGKQAKLLEVTQGAPLLQLTRIVTCFDHVPIEFRVAFCRLGANAIYAYQLR
jgi:GntR family transcriptional regulator